jgi:adenosylcobyric acid synthase
LPAEDAVALEDVETRKGTFKIAVFRLPRIANFDDLDPLRLEPKVELRFVKGGEALPGDCNLAIIPGSKSTLADLAYMRSQGWDIDLVAHVRRGGQVLGLCGGYQMLGNAVHDPLGLEGKPETMRGLGFLDVETTLQPDKTVTQTLARHIGSGEQIDAYEIHLGHTTGADCARPFAETPSGRDGAVSASGKIVGTYLHGCFKADGFRRAFLNRLGHHTGDLAYDQLIETTLDDLAKHLEQHIDIDALLKLATPVRKLTHV